MMRARPAMVSAEAVAAVATLRTGAGRHLISDALRWRVHFLTILVAVVAVRLQVGLVRLRALRSGDGYAGRRRQLGVRREGRAASQEQGESELLHVLLRACLAGLRVDVAFCRPVVGLGVVLG